MPSALNSFVDLICDREKYLIPANTIEYSRLVLADTLATIVGGIAEPEMQNLIKSDLPLGEIKILGTDFKTDYLHAAFLTGTAGTFLEMDEGNNSQKGIQQFIFYRQFYQFHLKQKLLTKNFWKHLSLVMMWPLELALPVTLARKCTHMEHGEALEQQQLWRVCLN